MSSYGINEMTGRWKRNGRDEVVLEEPISFAFLAGRFAIGFCLGYGLCALVCAFF